MTNPSLDQIVSEMDNLIEILEGTYKELSKLTWTWITDQMPPKDSPFLAFCNGTIISCEWCNDVDDFIPNCGCTGWEHERCKIKITAWMHLPKPPKESCNQT